MDAEEKLTRRYGYISPQAMDRLFWRPIARSAPSNPVPGGWTNTLQVCPIPTTFFGCRPQSAKRCPVRHCQTRVRPLSPSAFLRS